VIPRYPRDECTPFRPPFDISLKITTLHLSQCQPQVSHRFRQPSADVRSDRKKVSLIRATHLCLQFDSYHHCFMIANRPNRAKMTTTTRSTATTTYPFYQTTYTNASPSSQSSYLTTYTDTTWLPYVTADTWCASATAYPSIEGPVGLKPACVISNAAEINQHAFWDVYECCPGRDMSASGYSVTGDEEGNPGMCMIQCTINDDDGVTWQQVGECLQKRVKEVVCMPQYIERTDNSTVPWASKSTSAAGTTAATRPGGATSGIQTTSATPSADAAASFDIVHTSAFQLGLFLPLLLAGASAVGMLL
jgi:hypothetical protein